MFKLKNPKLIPLTILLISLILISCAITNYYRQNKYIPQTTSDTQIFIENIKSGETIQSPLKIIGQARGSWYFEGDFPIKLYDESQKILLAETYATAQDEWMTNNFVPFIAELNFDTLNNIDGWLVLEKDNPSDLLENEDSLKIYIKFNTSL